MSVSKRFIKATEEFNTFEQNVPAHYFRKTFSAEEATDIKLTIAVCGLYELWFNGKKITRGMLSPYINNTDHFIYYDEYEITCDKGENVIGVIIGNGFQNNTGGYTWYFDQATFRSAPLFSLCVTQNENVILESDEKFKVAPSPILFDDYHFGEHYDANFEIDGWNQKGFDDSAWKNALSAVAPKGELRWADVDPIVTECELKPVAITKSEGGFIYDFGRSGAGVCRLQIKGEKGQKIELRHAESLLSDGNINLRQVFPRKNNWEQDKDIIHCDMYTCKGEGTEVYQPSFTYHGFRYVRVDGITEEQATEELLTYLVCHTKLNTRGGFECSDEVFNKVQEMTRRSVATNFYHFPTDCPQREKNGWLKDAILCSEAAILNFDPERNWKEWFKNILKAQTKQGGLPGIVPCIEDCLWYEWGNGPAWGEDILAYFPYLVYLYRGDTQLMYDTVDALRLYLNYMRSRADERGLVEFGLGDWVHVTIHKPKAPLVAVASVMAMDVAKKAAFVFDTIGLKEDADFARSEYEQYRKAIRENLIDLETGMVQGECQTCQAMYLYYGVFEKDEDAAAFERLLEKIHVADDHMDCGVLGGRVIFHVLTRFGYADLAYKMIARDDYPSYGNWIKRGATALWENFLPDRVASMNHQFWGDISAWFIKCIAGIQLNPTAKNVNEVVIHPTFITALDDASAFHNAPAGKISSAWVRKGNEIELIVDIPDGMTAVAVLDNGYKFADGATEKAVITGIYTIVKE